MSEKKRGKTRVIYECKNKIKGCPYTCKRIDFLKVHEFSCEYNQTSEETTTVTSSSDEPDSIALDIDDILVDENQIINPPDDNTPGEEETDEIEELEIEESNDWTAGGSIKIKDILMPNHSEIPDDILKGPQWMEERMPNLLKGYTERVDSHSELYKELFKRNKIGVEFIPFANYKLTDKQALYALTARDMSFSLLQNLGARKLEEATKPMNTSELDAMVDSITSNMVRNIQPADENEEVPIKRQRKGANADDFDD